MWLCVPTKKYGIVEDARLICITEWEWAGRWYFNLLFWTLGQVLFLSSHECQSGHPHDSFVQYLSAFKILDNSNWMEYVEVQASLLRCQVWIWTLLGHDHVLSQHYSDSREQRGRRGCLKWRFGLPQALLASDSHVDPISFVVQRLGSWNWSVAESAGQAATWFRVIHGNISWNIYPTAVETIQLWMQRQVLLRKKLLKTDATHRHAIKPWMTNRMTIEVAENGLHWLFDYLFMNGCSMNWLFNVIQSNDYFIYIHEF